MNTEPRAAVQERPNGECRLCNGSLQPQFNLTVLGMYDVRYFLCLACQSLQTEVPYWLNEAYRTQLSILDTGAVQRNLQNAVACYVLSKLCGLKNVIDFGGGDGLLCRLLRDYGLNCFVVDKHAPPTYAQGFTQPDFAEADLLTAFEVWEHFANPGEEIAEIFKRQPKLLLVSTVLYRRYARDWWYLAAESGQHVFFYSQNAIRLIAKRFAYSVWFCGDYIVFARSGLLNPAKLGAMGLLLRRRVLTVIRAALQLKSGEGARSDFLSLKSKDQ